MSTDTRVRVEVRPGRFALLPPAQARALRPGRFEPKPRTLTPAEMLMRFLRKLAAEGVCLPTAPALKRESGIGPNEAFDELIGELVEAGEIRYASTRCDGAWHRAIRIEECGTILRTPGCPELSP